jgi:hypothetical protein
MLVSRGRDPTLSLLFHGRFLLISLMLVCFALPRQARAGNPQATNSVLPGGDTADGQRALQGATGFYDSAFGFLSLLSNGSANFNTGVGAGTLLVDTAIENTAVGAGTLLSDTTGFNTGCGAFALFTNSTGQFDNAVGSNSLLSNVDGYSNNAFGESALLDNVHGVANTAIGDVALANNDSSSAGLGRLNTAIGAAALFNNVDGGSNNGVGSTRSAPMSMARSIMWSVLMLWLTTLAALET